MFIYLTQIKRFYDLSKLYSLSLLFQILNKIFNLLFFPKYFRDWSKIKQNYADLKRKKILILW